MTVGAAQAAQTQRVLVFAAASLSEALHAVADAFTAETGISVAVSYGGTAIIARQIEQGAPADIFISADGAWMNYVADRGLIDPASRTELLGNSLVLIAPAATDFDLGEDIGPAIRELIGPGRLLAMANIGAVPAGRYGKTALETLGVWSDIARFIAQADSVRGALAFVARAETPLGIVYATDAAAEPPGGGGADLRQRASSADYLPGGDYPGRQWQRKRDPSVRLSYESGGRLDFFRPRISDLSGTAIMWEPLTSAEWMAIGLSLRVGLVATLFALPLAILMALVLARGRFPGRTLLDGLVHLPLVAPPVVTGYLLLLAFETQGPIGAFLADQFGIVIAFRWTVAAVAAAVMGFPLMVRAMRLSVEAIDRRLEGAAATLGAGRLRILATVTLPLMLPGILAGAVLGFARGLGEFGATITFVANIPGQTQTIPTAIYTALQTPDGEGPALRLTVLAVLIALAALISSEVLARRLARRIAPA